MNKIAVFTQGAVKFPYKDVPKTYITSVVRKTLKQLTLDNVSVSIIVSDNEFIKKINADYRKKDYPTDVISFAYREQPFPEIKEENEVLGDIYISAEKAKEQAEEIGHSLSDEFARLLVHGILHLIGYDHEKGKKEEKRMQEMEDYILERI
ncbi:MAG: rRNA maturation RNase YbeY [Spirochaetes bacterium]|nr:rRNA maturation RNase YbeY [Spirochaetota bacterium]